MSEVIMSNDNKRRLYEALSQDYDMGNFEQFCSDINDDAKRRKLYDATSEEYDFGDYDSFSRQLGYGNEVAASASPTHVSPIPDTGQHTFSTIDEAPAVTTDTEQPKNAHRPVRGVDYSTAEDAPEPEWKGLSDAQLAELHEQMEQSKHSMEKSRIESQERILNMGRHQSKSINNETVKGGLEFNPATGKVEQTYITPTGDKTFDRTVADMVSREYRTTVKDWHESQKLPGIDEMIESAEREVKDLTTARDRTQRDTEFAVGGVPGGVNVRSYRRSKSSGINTEADKQIDLAQSKLIMANQMKRLMEQGEKFGKGPGFKEAFKSWQSFKDGTVGNLGKFSSGIIDWFTDPDIMGVLSMSAFAPVREVAEKMDAQRKAYADAHNGSDDGFEPSLSAEEKEVMDYFMRLSDIESKASPSMAFTVGRAIPEIVSLGVQLAYNPASGAGRMAQTATREAVKGLSKTAYRKGAEYAARALGDIAEGVVAAGTTQLGQTLGRAERLAASGEDNALGTALMSQASGNFGLMAGKYFAPVGQAIWKGVGTAAEKAGMGTVKGFVDEVLSQTTKNGAADFAKSLHLTGTLENTLGAKLGEALNGVTAGEITFDTNSEHGLFNAHRFAETLTEFAVLDGVMKGYHAMGYRTPVYRAKMDMEMASHRASLAFGDPRVWQSILTSLKGGKRTFGEVADQMRGSTTDNPLPGRWSILEDAIMSGFDESVAGSEGVTLHDGRGKEMPRSMKAVYDILSNPAYTNEQRGAALDFVRAAMRYDGMRRGVEMNRAAQNEAAHDVEYSEVEAQRLDMHREWESAYEGGRQLMEAAENAGAEEAADTKAEIDGVVNRMREAYGGIEDVFGNDSEVVMAEINDDPWKVLDNPDIPYDGRTVVLEYINAKAAMDGVSDAANESIEQKRMSVEKEITMRTHKDSRMIQPVVMTGTGQPVYVVKGTIEKMHDGSGIDVRKSSDFIVVYDSTTGEYEFTSPNQIESVEDPIEPQREFEEAMRTYEEDINSLLNTDTAEMPEDVDAAAAEKERTDTDSETVALPENAENGESAVPDEMEVSNRQDEIAAVETQEETALSRIPLNAQGKPDFAAAETPDVGWDGLVERYKGDERRAQGFADNMVAIRQQELNKAKKIKSKPTEDPDEWDASEQAREAAIDRAQSALDAWAKIAGVSARRKAEVEARIAAETAAREAMEKEAERLKAEEEAQWEEQKKKLDSHLRDTAEKYRDMPEVLQILEMNTPTTIDEVASVVLSTNKVLLNNTEHGNHKVKVGAKHHVGFGKGEQRKLFGLFASEAKGGKSLERLAEDVFEEACQDYGVPYDNSEALNALIDMIRGSNTIGDIRNYITDKRIREAERVGEARRAQEMEAYDGYCQDAYGMSGTDYDAYEELLYSRIMEQRKDFDEQEFYRNIADEIIEEQRKRAENESRTGIGRVEEAEPARAVTTHGGSGEVLPGAQPDIAAGVATDGRGSEISGRDGHKEHDQRSSLSGEAPGERGLISKRSDSGETVTPEGKEYDPQELDKARAVEAEYLADREADLDAVRHDEAVRDVSPEAIDAIDEHRADMEHEVEPTEEMTQSERDSASESAPLSYVEPTEAQKAAGNYKMGHRKVDGHSISIENPKGSVRRGKDADGKEWETEMHNDYGYIRGKKGVDGDHIDVFLSDNPENGDVFVIDQVNSDGTFDEHKVMYGFPDEQSARKAYLSNYEDGWNGLGAITHVSKEEFKKWIRSSKRATKPFADYKSVTHEQPVSNAVKLQWSDELAANGEPFLIGKNGSINLVDIPKEVFDKMGITKAPFRLTPSMVSHVYERHKKELHLSTHADAVAAIINVMTNFDHVRKGRENTYVFSNEGTRTDAARRAITFVLEYDKGEWLGIRTVGYDRITNIKELPILWEKGEGNSSTTGVAPANVTSNQSSLGDQTNGIASNQTMGASDSKDKPLLSNKQEIDTESSEKATALSFKIGLSVQKYCYFIVSTLCGGQDVSHFPFLIKSRIQAYGE